MASFAMSCVETCKVCLRLSRCVVVINLDRRCASLMHVLRACYGPIIVNVNEARTGQVDIIVTEATFSASLFTICTVDGNLYSNVPLARVLYIIHDYIDMKIKQSNSSNECLIHASACCMLNNNVAFIGQSRAGKTSLLFELALNSHALIYGDEYMWLDLARGTAQFELTPWHIRQNTLQEMGLCGRHGVFQIDDEGDFRTFLLARSALPTLDLSEDVALHLVIFPVYEESGTAALLDVPVSELPFFVLRSAAMEMRPSETFGRFLGMVRRHSIGLKKLVYQNVADAAALIITALQAGQV